MTTVDIVVCQRDLLLQLETLATQRNAANSKLHRCNQTPDTPPTVLILRGVDRKLAKAWIRGFNQAEIADPRGLWATCVQRGDS